MPRRPRPAPPPSTEPADPRRHPDRPVDRRRALAVLGGAGLAAVVGCSSGAKRSTGASSTTASTAPPSTTTTTADPAAGIPPDTTIPYEIAGPTALDGSTGRDVLQEAGIVRSDIRSSFGPLHGTASGVPATIDFVVLDAKDGDRVLPAAAVYLWHCDPRGLYSLYDRAIADQNYLRGVQVSDAQGRVSFRSIFAGAYATRWPHLHVEVYDSLGAATSRAEPRKTTQLALPEAACQAVYATPGYEQSRSLLPQTPLSQDLAFKDGYALQMVRATGDPRTGYTLSLSLPV